MEYLDKVLGIEVAYMNGKFEHLPNFIATRYRLQMVSMNGQRVIFLYPKTELEQIEVLKKHIARIQKKENLPGRGKFADKVRYKKMRICLLCWC